MQCLACRASHDDRVITRPLQQNIHFPDELSCPVILINERRQRMQADDFDIGETARTHDVLEHPRGNRVPVSWIEVEIARADAQILRIGCFDDRKPGGLQYSQRLTEQMDHISERQMLNDVKARNGPNARILKRLQILE